MNQELKKIIRQNEIMISLLGRIAFDEDKVRNIIVRGKRKDLTQEYIRGYNACDGTRTVSEIASIIGISDGTLSPILKKWEELGIIYEIERSGGKFYKRILPIGE